MKKILVTLFLFALAIPCMQKEVEAANTTDTPYSFNLSANSTSYSRTSWRLKQDDSSLYINPRTMTGTLTKVNVKAYGAADNHGNNCDDYTVGRKTYYYQRNHLGGSYEVYNKVWETDGVTHEALGIATGGGAGQTGGYWSPDTAGTFNLLPNN